tara:strand:- start:513 stop:836 length:324 start_codon:yes stop_codon:yes gene_type:complete
MEKKEKKMKSQNWLEQCRLGKMLPELHLHADRISKYWLHECRIGKKIHIKQKSTPKPNLKRLLIQHIHDDFFFNTTSFNFVRNEKNIADAQLLLNFANSENVEKIRY